eukprot:TRINITY_DN29_c0_g1_i1.p1 TRINITY_DN29_c0_g1~~TRINITY_DN29_c0_g1_i1.p1  ORF type:complete len:567 (-),score=86.92 TRINITY_DN29_c0_g1_i1:164-1864(-)
MYHRALVTRIPELLDNIKAEFDALTHELNLYKAQRDDYERKLQAQLSEVQNIQATLFELERNHNKIKQQYEEEILRLRRQAEMQTPASQGASAFHSNGSSVPASSPLPGMLNSNTATLFSSFAPGMSGLPSLDKQRNSSFTAAPQASQPLGGIVSGKRTRENEAGGNGVNNFYGGAGASLPAINFSEGLSPKQPKTENKPESSFSLPMPIRPAEAAHPAEKPAAKPVESKRTEPAADKEADWNVIYNPNVQTNFNVELGSTLDHSSVVCCVRFSHDGKYLATGCNRSAQIYDVETGDKLHTFSDEASKDGDLYIRSVCFSPDGKLLAAGAEDKTVKVWDIERKRLSHTFTGHEMDIYSLDFTSDGQFIVSGSGDKKAKVWDVEKGKCIFTLGNDELGPKDGVTSVAISPDGRLIAAGSLDRVVRLWDAQTGYFLDRYEGHLDSVYSVAFSPDGRSLASGSLDKTLKLWDLSGSRTRSRCRSTFTGHKDFVLSVAFSPDGNWLISGSKDRNVQFWDPRTAVTHMMLQGHKNSVISVAVNPLNGSFATGSGDFRARIWRYKSCFPSGP